MLAHAIGVSTNVTLKGHMFKLDNKIYAQNGAGMSLSASDDMAKLFMVWWRKGHRERLVLSSITLTIYSLYVDDINIVAKTHPEGSVYKQEASTM